MINLTKEQKADALAEEIHNIKKWVNPKGKTLRVSKIEEDGSKTIARVLQMGDMHENLIGGLTMPKENTNKINKDYPDFIENINF